VPVNVREPPLPGLPSGNGALKVFCTCSYAVTEIELIEAVYVDVVAEKVLDTLKPS
jgi:hypothetical protein